MKTIALFMALLVVSLPICLAKSFELPDGKIIDAEKKSISITKKDENGRDKDILRVVSTSDNHFISDKEWAYENKGYELLESDYEMVVIGDYVCVKDNYYIEDKGTVLEKKTYTDCVYYPPHYVDKILEKDVELVQDDGSVELVKAGTVIPQQARSIEKQSDYSVKVMYEDGYDPTATELQVGMVSYWTLDADATDDYSSNDGSVTGADLVSAKIDNGYDFEASDTEDYITVPDDNSLDIQDAISISFWINPESFGHGYIVNKFNSYLCQMSDTNGNVQCGIWYDNGGPSWQPMVADVVGTGWSHIVFTYNRSVGGTQEAKMYVNNSLVDTGNYNDSIYTGSSDLGIGNRLSDYARDFDGIIDEVGLWNRVLDSDDVSELFANGDGYQPFEESSTIWSRSDICPSWTGNSGWDTAEFRAHIESTGSYDEVRFKFCAGTDEDLRILNLSVCYTTDSTPSTDETCSDFVTHTGDGATGDWRYIEIAAGACEWSDWLDYDWQSGREHFLQWGTQSGSYDGNKYVSGCSSNRLSRIKDTTAHVMNPSWTSDSWEGYMYDLEEIEGRSVESYSPGDAMDLMYDANGNLVSGDGMYRVYNSLNQLSKIYNGSLEGELLQEYTYHPTEERVLVKKTYEDSSLIETVYYVDSNFVRVVNSSGSFDYTYVKHEGQLVAQKNPDGSKIFIHADHLGSSTVVTDSSGDVLENTTYSPYGQVVTGGTSTRYGYEGKEHDSVVGDTDFHFRKYKSEWGLFTQPDTLIQNVYDPQSLNRYMFERGNPYRYTDPDGHALPALGAIAIGLVVAIAVVSTAIFVIDSGQYAGKVWRGEATTKDAFNYYTKAGMQLVSSYTKPITSTITTVIGMLKPEEKLADEIFDENSDDKKPEEETSQTFETYEVYNRNRVSETDMTQYTVTPSSSGKNTNVFIRTRDGSRKEWKHDTINGIPFVNKNTPKGTDVGGGWIVA